MFLVRFLAVFILLSLCQTVESGKIKYVHLALTGDPTSMVISYYTDEAINQTVAKWGLSSGVYIFNATGESKSWKKGYGYNHDVTMTFLKPNTKYYYVCGDGLDFSEEKAFVTAPERFQPFTIAVYGDMGIDNSKDTINRLIQHSKNNEFDWIYHVGDISYADDHVFYFQYAWNTWFESMEPITSTMPYMVLPGNHEYVSFDPFLYEATKNFVVYNQRFKMPGKSNMYYSFDYANVHFISISTETSFPNAPFGGNDDFGDQIAWLEKDLQEANQELNRQQRPWIIVGGHRPIYSSCSGYSKNGTPVNNVDPPSNSATLQKNFEDLFVKYKVDLILTGHVHSYERNYPAYKDKRTGGYHNPPSPVGIVVGCAGNIEGKENGEEKHWDTPQPEWSAFRYGDQFGYGVLKVWNNTHIEWKFFSAPDDKLQDSFILSKDL